MIDIDDALIQPPKDSSILHISFEHLNQTDFNTGYIVAIKHGQHYHQVTNDITVSLQTFHGGALINTLYVGDQPLHVQLEDEITPYYSDYIEWRYILTGQLVMEFEGEHAIFKEHEICFINSSAYHRESIEYSECVSINIGINRDFFNERFINSIALTPLQKFLRTNILHRGHVEKYLKFTPISSDETEIKNCVFTIFNEARFQRPGYLDINRGYVIRLMDILSTGYRFNFSKDDSSKYYDSLFTSVSEYMQRNMGTVSMDDLIDNFHFQSNYFNNLIKRYTGLTYSNYLIKLRMEHAEELLKTTDLSIEEIMWMIGYQNKSFFYRCFAKSTGTSPARYRKAAVKQDRVNK